MSEVDRPGITFLFTDIEGSTSLWEKYPEAMRVALSRHDALLRRCIEDHSGRVFKTVGDAFYSAFPTASDALAAALDSQRALLRESWTDIPQLRVRMALNTGTAEERDGDYFGPALNRVARLLAAGHGGQTLLSLSTKDALGSLPEAVELRALGERRLKDLSRPERIFQVIAPGLPSDFPPLNTLEAVPNNLPTALTAFIGREREISEIKRLLSSTHLLTLTGAGGCGKTRLSIQVAADLLDTFPGGVWFVELAALTDPASVPSALATAMGIREDPSKPTLTTVAETFRSKTSLLILDNCEHLVTACAEASETLLRACLNLRVIASSREALGIGGETIWRVPSLPEDEAVRLFCDRAVAAAPKFEFTEPVKPSIMQICQRLDGIPLAIELAAARVNVLHVDQIASRLNDRFRLLTGGSRTALPRQRTLRAAIDWSYDLLGEVERKVLRRISTFAGGFTLEAAEATLADESVPIQDILDLLTRLVEKSLVIVESSKYEARYSLLDMVRQYSRDRLMESGEAEAMGGRHRDYFLTFAEQAGPELVGPDQERWFDRFDLDHENFRAALTWSQADPEGIHASLRLAAALSRFWFMRGYYEEGRMWLKDAMARAGASTRTSDWAKALRAAGSLAAMQSDYVSARALLEESLAIAREMNDLGAIAAILRTLTHVAQTQGNLTLARRFATEALEKSRILGSPRGIASALSTLAGVLENQGENDAARTALQESLSIFRELNLKDGIAHNLDALGILAANEGHFKSARSLHNESLTIHRKLGDKARIASVLLNLGDAALADGDIADAESFFKEGLQIASQLGLKRTISLALHNLGLAALKRNDLQTSRDYLLKGLRLRDEMRDKVSLAYSLEAIAALAVAADNPDHSARLLGSAEGLREAIGAPLEHAERRRHEQLIQLVQSKLTPQVFRKDWEEGRSMPLPDAIAQAFS